MIRTADGVFVVFDHDHRVALALQGVQRVQQQPVVARMQADGRFVEDVADAAQIGTELGGQADALRFAARQCRRGAVKRQIAETDLLQKRQTVADLGQDVATDLRLAAFELDAFEHLRRTGHRQLAVGGDGAPVQAHGQRFRVQPLAMTGRTYPFLVLVAGVPGPLLAGLLGVEALEQRAGAEAALAPAALGVV